MQISKYALYFVITILVLLIALAAGASISAWFFSSQLAGHLQSGVRTAADSAIDGSRVNILIMGNDARPGEGITRSDTLMLVSIDPHLRKAVFLLIPRDTKWESKRHGVQKINAALAFDGPEAAVNASEKLLDVKIDHYAVISFEAFIKIIDALGGVEIDVQEPMHKEAENIHLEEGRQVLNGEDALGFVRYRDYLMGDVDRDQHQAIFIKALAAKILSADTLVRLPELVMAANDLLVTDMLLTEMLEYASWAPAFSPDSIITQTLPGSFDNDYDESGSLISCYWIVTEEQAHGIIDDLYAGKHYEVY